MTQARGGGGGQQVTVKGGSCGAGLLLCLTVLRNLSSLIALRVKFALAEMQPGRASYSVPHLLHWCGSFLC